MRSRLFSAVCALAVGLSASASAAPLGQLALYWDKAGWLNQATAQQHGETILKNVKVTKGQNYSQKTLADWVKANTSDGEMDILLTFGDFPETLYTPGNVQQNDSLIEKFIDGGNMVWNTADYIFYVVNGAGTNGDMGLKTITNSSFDLWTDNNLVQPTADGKKYIPSLKQFLSHRSWKKAQVDADSNWDFAGIFGEGPLGVDPGIIVHAKTGGYVGFFQQYPDDSYNRSDVFTEIMNHWVPTVATAAVDPQGKAASSWGRIKALR